jgi:hypothetical protein
MIVQLLYSALCRSVALSADTGFQRMMLPPYSTLNMEAVYSSEKSAYNYKTKWYHNSEDQNLNIDISEKLCASKR